ncbi:MAG TPA: uroporphyrinogen-III synthase [Planctomycetota bacterium]|nr:uroporphyrinogen-III synthase [Planctomycetota bacterium]HNR98466.1 uroporphyrinogen-III synthase [Planctomycetota bacterium]HNU25114.1 uroporphyrinogen-III synthase [Planctomycetota bacterium]HOE30102.1 uroporphyrinogen-III synthase [Planctomycetota bacterium]HOE87198.1 uroporphyrinogen-III synthase [Planctomycetota bacterium]
MRGARAGGRALRGMTVVVTRSRDDGGPLAAGIEAMGGEALVCPAIRVELGDAEALGRAAGSLARFDWIVFTSANGVRSLAPLLERTRFSGKIAVIGNATAAALRRLGYEEHLASVDSTGAALAAVLGGRVAAGERVLAPRSDIAGGSLEAVLKGAGADVCSIVSYRTRPGTREDAAPLLARLGARIPDAVLFASPSAVRGLQAMLEAGEFERFMRGAKIVSIGPTTSAQIAALGFAVAREARHHTNEGMLEALAALAAGRGA